MLGTMFASDRSARLCDGIAIAVLAFCAAIVALTFRDFGIGWDDFTHSEYGALLVSLYSSGFEDKRALSFVNLYMYGGGFDLLSALTAKILPFDLFETRRLDRRRARPDRDFRDVAARPPSRRAGRGTAGATPARHLPAL